MLVILSRRDGEGPSQQLVNGNGGLIALNHDWRDDQEEERFLRKQMALVFTTLKA